jgi:hypothetical protein
MEIRGLPEGFMAIPPESDNFIGPDGPDDADFATTTLDADPLCLHRRPEETAAIFEERVCDELRVREEHNRRKKPVQVIVFQCNSERSTNELGGPSCD